MFIHSAHLHVATPTQLRIRSCARTAGSTEWTNKSRSEILCLSEHVIMLQRASKREIYLFIFFTFGCQHPFVKKYLLTPVCIILFLFILKKYKLCPLYCNWFTHLATWCSDLYCNCSWICTCLDTGFGIMKVIRSCSPPLLCCSPAWVRVPRPGSRESVILWFSEDQKLKRAGYERLSDTIATWFHGNLAHRCPEVWRPLWVLNWNTDKG